MRQVPPDLPNEQCEPSDSDDDFRQSTWTAAVWMQWIVGVLGSWAVVWIAGPLVLDSILVRVPDSALAVATLRTGDLVRWRSEGWGNTLIGPHGLPGWQSQEVPLRIILWGDSQVEGVCVDDAQKIHRQLIEIAHDQWQLELDCLPMGRSGADARQWRDLMDQADSLWAPVLHVWVVTDLSDLTSLVLPGDREPYQQWAQSPAWVTAAAALRAEAIFAAGKRILRDPDTGGLRRLNFAVGPRTLASPNFQPWITAANGERLRAADAQAVTLADAVAAEVLQVERRFAGRLAILYAPGTPTLGQPLVTEHPDDAMFELIRDPLVAAGIDVVDMRQGFIELWFSHMRLPRGFHNGMPGYGHLNADGNRVVARALASLVQERRSR